MSSEASHLWQRLNQEANTLCKAEPTLRPLADCLTTATSLGEALAKTLSMEFSGLGMEPADIEGLVAPIFKSELASAAFADLDAVLGRDPAAHNALSVLFFSKGFLALQNYRVAHALWQQKRYMMALFLQAASAKRWAIDIHPAAQIGRGIMIDHGHGVVIGETAVVGNHVSILHGVTLGGTGKETGDRHPKIASGVMIGAGAKILGNITVGAGARIAAGSVVLKPVPPHVTVAGVPARIIGEAGCDDPASAMDQTGGIPDLS